MFDIYTKFVIGAVKLQINTHCGQRHGICTILGGDFANKICSVGL
jgi:hypothetical protein